MTTESSGKTAEKGIKNGKKRKKRRSTSKSSSSESSCNKDSTSSVKSKVSGKSRSKKQHKTKPHSSARKHVVSSASDDSTDTSVQRAWNVESDGRSSSVSIDIAGSSTSVGKSWQPADGKGLTSISEETIRWNGACDDPVNEAKRLENYKANRRQRYYELASAKAHESSRYYAAVETVQC